MPASPHPEPDPLEALRETIKALIVANEYLDSQNRELTAMVSPGYVRGSLPPDRKDWYD